MRTPSRLLAAMALLSGVAPSQAPVSPERVAAFVAASGSLGMRGAVLVARDGKVVWSGGVGLADSEPDRPNTATTLLEIASATKQFTAAAILRLVEQNKLDLDDPIAEHLPGVPESCAAITVRHLLQHTSGIPGANSQGSGDDLAAVLPLFLAGGPRHEPGTHWEYWNQGYALLATIVERVSRRSYPDFCRRELFQRAGLEQTCFTGDAAPRKSVVAVGTSARGPARSALEHPYGSYGLQYKGMGGAVSSVADLWRWLQALDAGRVLTAQSREEMFRPGPGEYGLGWFVRERHGRVVHEHGGGVRGFVCQVRHYPDDDAAVLVLANDDGAPVQELADTLEAALFADGDLTPPSPLDESARQAWIGRYDAEPGHRLGITTDGAATRLTLDWVQGMQTRAFLIAGDDGTPALFEWSATTPLTAIEIEDAAVTGFSLHSMRFTRAR